MSLPVFRFLDHEIVTARREILFKGETLPAEPKVYDLLLYLVDRRDRAVSKEEIQDAIWPNVIVTESAMTRCVMKARQLVGDDSKQQKVIKTVHKGGYRFVAEVEQVEMSALRSDEVSRDRASIVVLPFTSLSDDEDQAYLASGLTQDISTDLSRNEWLLVVSHRSSGGYQSGGVDYTRVADELGVQYCVEGSVRRSSDKVRVTAALIDAHSGVREWSEKYDRPLTDLFDIQDDISEHIVASLGSHVRRAEGRRAERADPTALDVWGLLHKGMSISWSRFNRESNLEAEQCYRDALNLEPDNPRAKAFLACNIGMKVSNGWSNNLVADQYEGWALGKEAISRLPDEPMVITSYGHMNTCFGKAGDAVDLLRRANELDPNSVWTLGLLALALTCAGRGEEAVPYVSKALRISPRDASTHWFLTTLAWAYLQQGHYDDAAREAQRSIHTFAGWPATWGTLGIARAALGQMDGAREAIEMTASLDPDSTVEGFSKWFGYAVRNDEVVEQIEGWLLELWPAQ